MNTIDKKYIDLLQDILDNGVEKKDRTGTGTLSVFGRQIRHSMREGFPLLTTKKMYFKGIVTELLWFLRGDTNIKYLVDNDCHIWDGDAYKNYCNKVDIKSIEDTLGAKARHHTLEEFVERIKTDDEFAKTWGELGPIYGKQWRSWGNSIIDDLGEVYSKEVEYDMQNSRTPNGSSMRKFVIDEIKKYKPNIDQIANLINELRTNPDSRRMMVNAWNVGELDSMVLPPCHYGFQVYTRELSSEERYSMVSRITDKKTPEDLEGKEWIVVDNSPYKIPTRAISLIWNQRSVDVPLGLPFNIASYGLLLEIIAKEVNMVPDELIGNLGDCHIYTNQIDGVKEQLTREPYELPSLKITERNWYLHEKVKERLGEKTISEKIQSYIYDCFELKNYQSHPKIKMPLSN